MLKHSDVTIRAKGKAALSSVWILVKSLANELNQSLAESHLEPGGVSWEHDDSVFQPWKFGGPVSMRASGAAETLRVLPRPATPERDVVWRAMRRLASGVSLITRGEGEARTGLTARSVSSLDADPPTLIVCLSRASSIYSEIEVGDRFGVSVLAAGQAKYADIFAGRSGLTGAERFREGDWLTTPSGVSLLADAVATFECDVEDLIDRRTHAIVIGRVCGASLGAAACALIDWRGAYDQLDWSATSSFTPSV